MLLEPWSDDYTSIHPAFTPLSRAGALSQAYEGVKNHARREFSSLLDMKADLRQTALHQMLRLHTKKMFHVGSALNLADTSKPRPQNGSKDRYLNLLAAEAEIKIQLRLACHAFMSQGSDNTHTFS